MPNCLSCGRREVSNGSDFCVTSDNKKHLILNRKEFYGDQEVKAALLDEGVNCKVYLEKKKGKVESLVAGSPLNLITKDVSDASATNPQTTVLPLPPPPKDYKKERVFKLRQAAGFGVVSFLLGFFVVTVIIGAL